MSGDRSGISVFSYWICRIFFRKEVDLADVVFSKERVKTVRKPDEDVERNLVSMEEALSVTDQKNLRTYMMNVLQRDYRESLSVIAEALNSEDSETSHYAASVLQDVLNEFRVHVDKKSGNVRVQERRRKCGSVKHWNYWII